MTSSPSDGSYEIDCHAVASDLREAMTNSEHIPNGHERLREQGVEVLRRLSASKVSLSDASFIAGWVTEARRALSSPAHIGEDEPVAYQHDAIDHKETIFTKAHAPTLMGFTSTPLYTRPSPSVPPQGETSEEDLASDDRWNAGVNYAIERLCEIFGIDPKSINWDAATETLDGDVMSVICNVLVAAYGEEWSSSERDTEIIRAALAPRTQGEASVLRELEAACEALAATRSQETYLSMVDRDKATDALARLDRARSAARALTPSPTLEPTDAEVERAGAELLNLLDNYMVVTSLTANDRYEAALATFRAALIASRQSTSGEGV